MVVEAAKLEVGLYSLGVYLHFDRSEILACVRMLRKESL